ncbi:MAG: hypothetical protein WCO58_00045 [bacterium]
MKKLLLFILLFGGTIGLTNAQDIKVLNSYLQKAQTRYKKIKEIGDSIVTLGLQTKLTHKDSISVRNKVLRITAEISAFQTIMKELEQYSIKEFAKGTKKTDAEEDQLLKTSRDIDDLSGEVQKMTYSVLVVTPRFMFR